jgi:hypothetical protein
MNKECGMCGEKDFNKLVGPFAGGPYPFYCKRCHLIIDDFQDMVVVPRNPERKALLMKWIKAKNEHANWILSIANEKKEQL